MEAVPIPEALSCLGQSRILALPPQNNHSSLALLVHKVVA
uniref:Uncharacterized protein n=1 Tax=Klebsiella pneumoniae TaxID=573 RepID=A0A7G5F722_KLEPN|nr:hypothetical protein [Klebsiella pneumoniae]